ncbi:hypothetical protein ACRQ5Q_14660 [Bradyrhizobium sp. PMVTL-01]|uniref:hypothetical protein n=1 Tax=Bradyrhizobium sp. PMVTL-01 TaxID=3434999 RepID=UPI003F70BF1A
MKVWVLIIDHRHGTDVTVHASKLEADAIMYAYCDKWWEREYPDEPRPDDSKLVARYWERQSDQGEESYLLEEREINDLQFPPILITENPYGVKPGFYTRPDIVRLLKLHAASVLAVRLIAKAIGGE